MSQIQSVIIAGLLKEFQIQFGLSALAQNDAFEHFINYLVISKFLPETLDDTSRLEDICVDEGQNFGIDGIAIIVNNNLVTSKEELEIYKKSKHLDVHFVFIQSKTSSSYDTGDILKFIQSVKNFFSSNPTISLNDELKQYKVIKDSIFEYQNAKFFSNQSPKCSLFYATTSNISPNEMIKAITDVGEKEIKDNFVDLKSIKIFAVGSEFIIETLREVENSFEVVINFKNSIALDNITGVEQAYIGYLSAEDFLKLISDSDGNLRKNLFYENVRDFQGLDNSVNKEMKETLEDSLLQNKFVLLNNGITVVTKHLQPVGGNFELRDFQIVNGCQTSNIIHRNQHLIKDKKEFSLPVKIIHTNVNDLISRIIKATNKQSPVPNEAFLALDEFHKKLQLFYSQMSKDAPEEIFYERRSREFSNHEPRIEKIRINNLHSQIRSFTAMFLGKPQDIHFNNPSTIFKNYSNNMFVDGQSYYPYYVSSYTHFKLQTFLNSRKVERQWSRFRYHLLLAFRILVLGRNLDKLNSKEIDKSCRKLIEVLSINEKCLEVFLKAVVIVEETKIKLSPQFSWKRLIQTNDFTDSIIEIADNFHNKYFGAEEKDSRTIIRKLVKK